MKKYIEKGVKAKQKGYIIILSLLFSVSSLSFSILYYGLIQDAYQKRKTEALIEDTSAYIVQFSNAVLESFRGYGTPESSAITVSLLKEQGLLNDGFPERVGLNQELRAYYGTNPSNEDLVDYLIVLEGEPSSEEFSTYGISQDIINRFNREIAEGVERRGINVGENSQGYVVGTFQRNTRELRSRRNDVISTNHFGLSNSSHVGVYAYAPNQVGYWRFQITPFLYPVHRDSRRVAAYRDYNNDILLRAAHSTLRPSTIVNEGFSHTCPSSYTVVRNSDSLSIAFNAREDQDSYERNLSRLTTNLCIPASVGDVQADVEAYKSYQIEGAFDENSPSPIASRPETWGRCYPLIENFFNNGLSTPDIDVSCIDPQNYRYPVFNPSANPDIRPITLDLWHLINNTSGYSDVWTNHYNNDFRNNNFKIPALFFVDTFSFKIGDRYVRIASYANEFISSSPSAQVLVEDLDSSSTSSRHNKFIGWQIDMQDFPFRSNRDTIEVNYTRYDGASSTFTKNIEYQDNY